jgi:NADH-quinone oxidoreductase subunit J
MMDWSFLAFVIFATIAVIGSLMVIFQKTPVSSAFSLVLVFFAFAGLYAILGAHFIAALQILVYTGAIMVLFVFVIMLLGQDEKTTDLKESSFLFKGVTTLGVLGLLSVLLNATLDAQQITAKGEFTEEKIREMGGNLQVISEVLFKDYAFHFELVSFLILGAIVATVALAKRKNTYTGDYHE